MMKRYFLHLFYKEWLKTRWAFLGTLLLGTATILYIFIAVENKITLTGAKTILLRILYDEPPVIYYASFLYIPLLTALAIGIAHIASAGKKQHTDFRHGGIRTYFADFKQSPVYRLVPLLQHPFISGRTHKTRHDFPDTLAIEQLHRLQFYCHDCHGTQQMAESHLFGHCLLYTATFSGWQRTARCVQGISTHYDANGAIVIRISTLFLTTFL